MEVAKEILRQLGGQGRLKMMINAKDYVALPDGVQFRMMPGKDGVNLAEIRLNGNDLYDVKFKRVRGANVYLKAAQQNVYVDMLPAVFRNVAGLAIQI